MAKLASLQRLLAMSGIMVVVATASLATAATIQSRQETKPRICEDSRYQNKSRVFIMTDISNEPDDQMSLVRLLTHSNELDIANIAVVTSTWKNDSIDVSTTLAVINAYGEVREYSVIILTLRFSSWIRSYSSRRETSVCGKC